MIHTNAEGHTHIRLNEPPTELYYVVTDILNITTSLVCDKKELSDDDRVAIMRLLRHAQNLLPDEWQWAEGIKRRAAY